MTGPVTANLVRTQINGQEYAVHPITPFTALQFAPRVMEVLAPVAARAVAEAGDTVSLDSLNDTAAMLRMLTAGLAAADAEKVSGLLEHTFATLEIRNADGMNLQDRKVFNDHFSARRADLFQVAVWAIWESNKDFFIDADGSFLAGVTAAAEASASKSPTPGKSNTDSTE